MKRLLYCLLILLSLYPLAGIGQDPVHFVIGESDFANIDIYSLMYDDSEDVLYVGTNSGVYVYKQNQFLKIKDSEDEIGSSFFRLQQNKKGELFCCNINGQIFKIVNDRLVLFHQIPSDEITHGFSFFFVEDDNIIAASQSKLRRIDPEGREEILRDQKRKGEIHERVFGSLMNPYQMGNGDLYIPIISNEKVLTYSNGKLEETLYPISNAEKSNRTYLSIGEKVMFLDNRGDLKSFEHDIPYKFAINNTEKIIAINENEVVGLDIKKGMRVIGFQDDTLVEKQSFFKEEFISAVCSNNNGTLFLGSFGEGIKVIPNKSIVQTKYDHLFLSIASSPDNTVYLSTRGGEIFKYQEEFTLVEQTGGNIDKVFFLNGDFKMGNRGSESIFYDSHHFKINTIKDFCQIDSSSFVLAVSGNLTLYSKKEEKYLKNIEGKGKVGETNQYFLFPNQRYSAVTWSLVDSMFYFANAKNVFSSHWSSSKVDTVRWADMSIFGNDLEYYNNQLICGTEKRGILFFENNKFVAQLSQRDGLKSNIVKKVQAKDGLLYILTNAGIQVYDLRKNVFLGLGVAEGLVSPEVASFSISEDKLWLMEKHSFFSIDISTFAESRKEYLIEKLYIDSILVNGASINYEEQNTFAHGENELNVFFDYRDVESKKETSLEYKLEGFYNDWRSISSTQNNIEFQYLPVGKYAFKIKATYRNQSTDEFSYAFEICPPFWGRWWFYVGLLALGLIITTLVFKSILKKQKEELAARNEINISKLAAIRSQMNPHFIFNALNSIQHLFLKGDADASYVFINKFASLVRKTLDFSEKDFITLKEEINLIEVYLTLEKLRFGDNFNFTIDKPENLKIKIPPLLIQPFIENAILHGLLHKKGRKQLRVQFLYDGKLTCTIEDNGIGRSKAKEIKERQLGTHKSFSLNAIKRRFAILSEYYGGNLGFEYIDFDPLENEGVTTRVILTIPVKDLVKNNSYSYN